MKSMFAVLALLASAYAQGIKITAPAENSHVVATKKVVVEVERPVSPRCLPASRHHHKYLRTSPLELAYPVGRCSRHHRAAFLRAQWRLRRHRRVGHLGDHPAQGHVRPDLAHGRWRYVPELHRHRPRHPRDRLGAPVCGALLRRWGE